MKTKTIDERVSALISSGAYKSKEDLFMDAYRALIVVKPNLKIKSAVELYKNKRASLSRAAEIAGVNIEEFKDILEIAGVKRIVESPSKDELEEECGLILKKTRV